MINENYSKGWINAAILASLTLLAVPAVAQEVSDVRSNGPLNLRESGSFYVSGDIISETAVESGLNIAGLRMINQMYVEFQKPLSSKGGKHYPIVFVAGGGLSGKSWQTTPDGRMGWYEYFVRNGFDTYLADQVARARSGFDGRKYNNVRAGLLPPSEQPVISLSTDVAIWNAFRFATPPCTTSPCYVTATPSPGIRFPMQTVGVGNGGTNMQFHNFATPGLNAVLSGAPAPADPAGFYNSPAQMSVLSKKLDGAILVGHSESASYPIRAALQPSSGCYPWTNASNCKVKGIIQLETGCFANLTPAEITTLSHIPILIEFGDFSPVPQPAAPCPAMMSQITAAGGDIRFMWTPALTRNSLYPGSPGPIKGNDHMIMLDDNNLDIADILIGWLSSRHI